MTPLDPTPSGSRGAQGGDPRGYASDWRDFAAWCALRGATALPAHVGIVAAYLSALAHSGRKSSTIGRRAAAIGYRHKLAGHEPPTNAEGVKAVLRGIRPTIGSAKQVGLDAGAHSGHSLRSGFLTSAAEAGASIWKLSEVSRHKSLDILRGYVRRVDLFKEHAGAAFL